MPPSAGERAGAAPDARGYNRGVAAARAGPTRPSLSVMKKYGIRITLPPDDPMLGHPLNNLALAYKRLDDFDGARRALERSLTIKEAAPPGDRDELSIATSLHNLGSVLINQGDHVLQGGFAAIDPWKAVLTYFVSYAVATYAGVAALRGRDTSDAGADRAVDE